MVLRALEAAKDALYDRDNPPAAQLSMEKRRADALGLVAECALHGELDKGTRGDRYQVVVHVDERVLAEPEQPGQSVLEGGQHVSAETSRRLACDSSKVVMGYGKDGSLLDVRRKTRVISTAVRRALAHRDGACRFPGCNAKLCDAHHVKHWANGGETKLENLIHLCRRHHRAVHEGGYRVEFLADGELEFYWPSGEAIPQAPPAPALAEDTVESLRARHGEQGLEIDPWTTTPDWNGEPMDLDWVMYVLRQNDPMPVPAN